MENEPLFNLPTGPLSLARGLRAVTVDRAGGERVELDAQAARLRITEEHPTVERMADDWGAICEVFKESAFYYVAIDGVRLQAGDRITLHYTDGRPPLALHVIELENGRARIQDPPR